MMPTRGAQVTFASPQSYEMTPRAVQRPNPAEHMENTTVHQDVDTGRRLLFQSPEQFRSEPRFSINLQYAGDDNSIEEQDPSKTTAPRRMSSATPHPMLDPLPRVSSGGAALAFNIHQRIQRIPRHSRSK